MYDDCPEEKKRTIDASVILDDIRDGRPVDYDYVTITGDLSPPIVTTALTVRGLPPQPMVMRMTNFSSSIKITNSIIQGKVTFEEFNFHGAVDFRETVFADEVSFKRSIFHQSSEFEGAHFQEVTHFCGSMLVHHNLCPPTHFIGPANFKKTVFEKYVDFSNVVFHKSAEFSRQNRQESFPWKTKKNQMQEASYPPPSDDLFWSGLFTEISSSARKRAFFRLLSLIP